MLVFIPLAEGQSIRSEVYRALSQQTVAMEIIPCVTKGVIRSNHNVIRPEDKPIKLAGECAGRNKIIEWLNEVGTLDPFIAMQDRDVVHLDPLNYQNCLEFLKEDDTRASVVLPWQLSPLGFHKALYAGVYRVDILKKIKFRLDHRMHICATLNEDISKLGTHSILKTDKVLIKELRV